jgi:hypothetical protein
MVQTKEDVTMIYADFISTLTLCQTSHVKAVSFPASCAIERLPDAFRSLLPSIVSIVDQSFSRLAKNQEVIALFGLQQTAGNLNSDIPILRGRIFDEEHPMSHFCCSLYYLTLQQDQLSTLKNWEGCKTLVVDFTAGVLMDGDQFIYEVFGQGTGGIIYGHLDEEAVARAWRYIQLKYYLSLLNATPLIKHAAG